MSRIPVENEIAAKNLRLKAIKSRRAFFEKEDRQLGEPLTETLHLDLPVRFTQWQYLGELVLSPNRISCVTCVDWTDWLLVNSPNELRGRKELD